MGFYMNLQTQRSSESKNQRRTIEREINRVAARIRQERRLCVMCDDKAPSLSVFCCSCVSSHIRVTTLQSWAPALGRSGDAPLHCYI